MAQAFVNKQEVLKAHVDAIADDIIDGIKITADKHQHLLDGGKYQEGDYMSAYDYVTDVLDIEWIANADKTYKACRLWVLLDGPYIRVNLESFDIEGFWGGKCAKSPIFGDFVDDLDEYMRAYFESI